MTLKVKNDRVTDDAWNALYKRFEEDGLLPATDNKPKRGVLHSTAMKWIAVAAVACICIISALVIRNMNTGDLKMYTLHNEENAPTLVTTLEDGSVVYLNQQTSIEYPVHFEKDRRKVSMQGDAFFEISKNRERPFFIETANARIEVLGTAFNVVSKDKDSFSLSVKHGEVKVTLKQSGQSTHVKAGETVLLDSDNLQKTISPDKGKFDGYLKQIHFKDERLTDVIRIINMNSKSTKLSVSPHLGDRLLTVTFSDNTPATMAELICLALNLKYTQSDNIITIEDIKN